MRVIQTSTMALGLGLKHSSWVSRVAKDSIWLWDLVLNILVRKLLHRGVLYKQVAILASMLHWGVCIWLDFADGSWRCLVKQDTAAATKVFLLYICIDRIVVKGDHWSIVRNLQLEQKLIASHKSFGAEHLDTHGVLTTEQRDMTDNFVLSCGSQDI